MLPEVSKECPPDCPICLGAKCQLCGELRVGGCPHDILERHNGMEPLPSTDKRPTKELEPLLSGKITIELDDGEQLAQFLEMFARAVRAKRKITLLVE